jgi:hypothetical protein
VFTARETQAMKNRLGYGNVTVLALPYVDVALVFETVVQNNVDAYGESYVRDTILPNLTTLDGDIMAARKRYQADELVGEIKLNKDEHERLLVLREFWIGELESTIKVGRARKMSNPSAVDVF